MRRALLFCAAIVFAIACGDDLTEPTPAAPVAPKVSFATTTTEDGLSISTDKDDYAPGDTVHFTGSGWPANDVLDVLLIDDLQRNHTWTIATAGDGTFQDSTYVVDPSDLGATFTLTATSRATGRSLTVTFKDGNVRVFGTPAAALFNLTVEPFGTSQTINTTCSGSPNSTNTQTVGPTGNNGTNVSAIQDGESVRLTAAATSTSGGAFLNWSPSTSASPYTSINAQTICVTGFQSGSKDYTVNYTAVPDLQITKTASTTSFTVGTNASYTLAVQNVGQLVTSGQVTVTDELPAGLTFVSAVGTGWACTGTSTITCNRSDTRAPGQPFNNIVITFTPTAAAVGSVTNTASVSGGSDISPGNNSSSVTNTVNGVIDLTIDKSHTGNFTRGTSQNYSIVVSNTGSAPTNANVTVTDVLPAGLTFVSGNGTGWNNCTVATQTVTCVRPLANAITAGSSAPAITLTVAVAANAAATITNTATVSGGGDANNTNNSDSDPTATQAAGPTKLAFTSAQFSAIVNQCSPQITVQTRNAANTPTNPTAATTVNLTTSSTGVGGGAFFSDNTCNTAITSVSIPTSGNAASFFYKDGTVGTPTLTAAAAGLTSATQQETITAAPNAAPAVSAGGAYSGAEGDAIALSPTVTDPDGDQLSYKWTVATTGIDAGGACTFDDDTKRDAKVTCTDDSQGGTGGKFILTLTVDDGHGHSVPASTNLTVTNANPSATFNTPAAAVNEGTDFTLSLTGGTDPSSNDAGSLHYAFDCGNGYGGATSYATSGTATTTSCNTADDGPATLSVKGKVFDKDGGSAEYTGSVTVQNVDPTATFTAPSPVEEGTDILLSLTSPHDPSGADVTAGFHYAFDCGTGSGYGTATSYATAGTNATKNCPTTDNDNRTVKGKIFDKNNGATEYTASVVVKNADPVVTVGQDKTADEGSATQLSGSYTDPGTGDTHTWTWAYTDGAAHPSACSFSNQTLTPQITCDDDGTVMVTLTVTDDDGGVGSDNLTLTVKNVPPTATFNYPSSNVPEGTSFTLSLSNAADVSTIDAAAGLHYAFDCGNPSAPVVLPTTYAAAGTTSSVSCTTSDNGTRSVKSRIFDKDNGYTDYTGTVNVTNVAPTITALTVSPTLVQIGGTVTLNATFTDPGTNDTHTASINWEDATTSGTVTETNGSGSVSATHTYSATGIYTVTLTVTDKDGGPATRTYTDYVVVYDPSAGFVTGGGWINSPAGAYRQDPTLTGKANFGFVSKYLKGANTPTGNTEFQFHEGSLNFSSTSYDWLVVQGSSRASYKGSGTVNGAPGYAFLLSVVDGTSDKFRLKIWIKATNVIVYDNQLGAADDADATQGIAGGSIVIHTSGGLATK